MAFNLNTTIDVSGFVKWWLGELATMLPEWLRRFFSRSQSGQLFMRLHNYQLCLFRLHDGEEIVLGEFCLHKQGAAERDDFFHQHPVWLQTEKVLLLNHQQVLRRHLTLPVEAQENLKQVVTYEIDRYLPYRAEDIYFVFRLTGKNQEGTQIEVELIAMDKRRLHNYYQELQTWGMSVDTVLYDDASIYAANRKRFSDYNLLPMVLRKRQVYGSRILVPILLSCFLGLAISAVLLPFWWQANRLSALQRQVAESKQKAMAVESLKLQSDQLVAAAEKINDIKTQSPSVLKILQQLTVLLPEDTWLKSFEFTGDKLSLEGVTASSTGLIGLLEDSPHFQDTSFTSPVTPDNKAGRDRFKLDTYIKSNHD